MRRQIQRVIRDQINPAIASHGGAVELVDYLDKTIYLRMMGGCQGCAASSATLRDGIERILRGSFGDEIAEIVDVTDHEAGQDPYYNDSSASGWTP